VRVAGGFALGIAAILLIVLALPDAEQNAAVAILAVFIALLVGIYSFLATRTDTLSVRRWDKMPEKVQCPDCLGSGGLEYRADGTRVPIPMHLVNSFANAHICGLCVGLGSTAQHPAARTGTWKRAP
jgi:hypothetical protein